MSAMAAMKAMDGLNEVQRRRVLQLQKEIETKAAELAAIFHESGVKPAAVELHDRDISETQAADLRARLHTFSEDWDRPETAIYDQSPAR